MESRIINLAENYTRKAFENVTFEYHNIEHVERTVKAAKKIVKEADITHEEAEDLFIAAWLHDIGYMENREFHEAEGAKMAKEFLLNHNHPLERIERIERLIMATRGESEDVSQLADIIRDADYAHFGSRSFLEVNNELRKELGIKVDDKTWFSDNLEYLRSKPFRTEAAQKIYDKRYKKNMKDLEKLAAQEANIEELIVEAKKDKKSKKKKDKKDKKSDTARGVETMFRVALRNHNQLSKIADNKANIMLSVTTIMLSLILSSLLPKLDTNPTLLYPTIITMIVCITSMYFAVLATRPKVNDTPYSRELLEDNKTNLLFFGNFYHLDLEEFEHGIQQMMEDRDLLYGALTKDLYYLGKVLAKKYIYLRRCYAIFMYGLIISAIAYIAAVYVNT